MNYYNFPIRTTIVGLFNVSFPLKNHNFSKRNGIFSAKTEIFQLELKIFGPKNTYMPREAVLRFKLETRHTKFQALQLKERTKSL